MTIPGAGSRSSGPCYRTAKEDRWAGEIREMVLPLLAISDNFHQAAAVNGTPLYLFEPLILKTRARDFLNAFSSHLEEFEAFFAVKCNNHPEVAIQAVASGLGLDVSSGLELQTALEAGCQRILFSGPGKADTELDLAAAHAGRVTVLMDSFGELERLERAAGKAGTTVTAGVRLTTREDGLWRKFGIPLSDLGNFLATASGKKAVRLKGLQFHTSWNLTPGNQVEFIGKLGQTLSTMDSGLVRSLEFLDIGGGFWPEMGEWLLDGTTDPSYSGARVRGRDLLTAAPIGDFAREIGRALKEYIFPQVPLKIYAEPGRWIADRTMHILISVVDRKSENLVIADAGTNILGWERYETDYVPVINLSRPSLTEKPCLIAGSLCTPHDVWGWSYFGEDIQPGDLLLLPWQGAYTWSLRQQFIKPLAKVVSLGV